MEALNTRLDDEFINEDEGIYTVGDNIASSFCCDDFRQGIKELESVNASTKDLLYYLENQAKEIGCNVNVIDLYNGHFDTEFFICLAKSHY